MISWQYIAGFFDGEGSLGHNGKGYRITIGQTNLEVFKQIKKFSRMGNIISIAKRRKHWKDAWVYYIARQAEVEIFLKKMLPHLVVKHAQTARVLADLKPIIAAQKERARLTHWYKTQTHKLRQRGLSYRAIGQALDIDWGYARRVYLKNDAA